MRLLVVEDNAELSKLIAKGLTAAGFEVDSVSSVEAATEALSSNQYATVVLDLGLPDGDGGAVVDAMRAKGNATPVLMLTARGSVQDRVVGLRKGADDYLIKPFAFEELVARIQALLRRPGDFLGKPIEVGNVTFDGLARQAYVDGVPQSLSARETSLLEILMRRSGRVVPKNYVEDQLFGLSDEVRSNAVEVYVHRLRKLLIEVGATVKIHTVRGVGYLLTEEQS